MIVVLLASSGAAWESAAFAAINAHPGTVVLKRCVDVADLVAAASTGQADVAVVGTDLAGLDQGVVDDLRRHHTRVVGVAVDPDITQPRAGRIGISVVLPAARMDEIGDLLTALPADPTEPGDAPSSARTVPAPSAPDPDRPRPAPVAGPASRVVAVWGPSGGPGRTLLACAVAGELARRGLSTLLVDADPHGGAVAQHLGVLDEVSGLLAASRLVVGGHLEDRFPGTQRRLSDHLRVLTGLPRADRWTEVRPGVLSEIVDRGRLEGHVVLDTGFSLEVDPTVDPGRPERNGLTREALEVADDVLLVGAADPVGLTRLARSVAEALEAAPAARVRVVVNRMRPSLGWRESDVADLLAGFGAPADLHFLPDDQAAVDRALVAGRLLVETGESALTRAVADLVDGLVDGLAGASASVPAGRERRRSLLRR